MNWLEAILFGIIQGATEFLPVSSSGHLALAHRFGLSDELPQHLEMTFDVMLHSASLVAILCAFRTDIMDAIKRGPSFWFVLAFGIVPTGMAGLLIRDWVDGASKNFLLIGMFYIFTASLLFVAQRLSVKRESQSTLSDDPASITVKQASFVGFMQILCLFAGVSRSGTTVASGLISGMSPRLAVSFSFLIGMPLLIAATGKDALDGAYGELAQAIGWGPVILASLVCMGVSYACIIALKTMVKKRMLHWFVFYCGLLAILCFVSYFVVN
jgi:undecaprenyl-diphosphatase